MDESIDLNNLARYMDRFNGNVNEKLEGLYSELYEELARQTSLLKAQLVKNPLNLEQIKTEYESTSLCISKFFAKFEGIFSEIGVSTEYMEDTKNKVLNKLNSALDLEAPRQGNGLKYRIYKGTYEIKDKDGDVLRSEKEVFLEEIILEHKDPNDPSKTIPYTKITYNTATGRSYKRYKDTYKFKDKDGKEHSEQRDFLEEIIPEHKDPNDPSKTIPYSQKLYDITTGQICKEFEDTYKFKDKDGKEHSEQRKFLVEMPLEYKDLNKLPKTIQYTEQVYDMTTKKPYYIETRMNGNPLDKRSDITDQGPLQEIITIREYLEDNLGEQAIYPELDKIGKNFKLDKTYSQRKFATEVRKKTLKTGQEEKISTKIIISEDQFVLDSQESPLFCKINNQDENTYRYYYKDPKTSQLRYMEIIIKNHKINSFVDVSNEDPKDRKSITKDNINNYENIIKQLELQALKANPVKYGGPPSMFYPSIVLTSFKRENTEIKPEENYVKIENLYDMEEGNLPNAGSLGEYSVGTYGSNGHEINLLIHKDPKTGKLIINAIDSSGASVVDKKYYDKIKAFYRNELQSLNVVTTKIQRGGSCFYNAVTNMEPTGLGSPRKEIVDLLFSSDLNDKNIEKIRDRLRNNFLIKAENLLEGTDERIKQLLIRKKSRTSTIEAKIAEVKKADDEARRAEDEARKAEDEAREIENERETRDGAEKAKAKRDEAKAKRDEAKAKRDEAKAKRDEAKIIRDEIKSKIENEAEAKMAEAEAKRAEAEVKMTEAEAKMAEAEVEKQKMINKRKDIEKAEAAVKDGTERVDTKKIEDERAKYEAERIKAKAKVEEAKAKMIEAKKVELESIDVKDEAERAKDRAEAEGELFKIRAEAEAKRTNAEAKRAEAEAKIAEGKMDKAKTREIEDEVRKAEDEAKKAEDEVRKAEDARHRIDFEDLKPVDSRRKIVKLKKIVEPQKGQDLTTP